LRLTRVASGACQQRLGHGQQRELFLPGTFPAEPVNCLAPGGGGQPAARIRRPAVGPPMLKCLDESVLDHLFRQANIAEPYSERSPDPGGLLAVRLLELSGIIHTRQSPSSVTSDYHPDIRGWPNPCC